MMKHFLKSEHGEQENNSENQKGPPLREGPNCAGSSEMCHSQSQSLKCTHQIYTCRKVTQFLHWTESIDSVLGVGRFLTKISSALIEEIFWDLKGARGEALRGNTSKMASHVHH